MGDAVSDLELLAVEIDTLWACDGQGRLVRQRDSDTPPPYLVVAVAAEGRLAVVSEAVPDALAASLVALAAGGPIGAPRKQPPGLDSWASQLAASMGPVRLSSGPSYVATSAPVASSPATILVSDGSRPYARQLQAPEGAGWEEGEWGDLLDGRLGPWAMAEVEGEIVSICFCARLTDVAAEAGLRTEPDCRRKGHGAAVTAAWAALVMATGRHAFYSTSADNLASQATAARLGLRPIGWIWQIGPANT